MSCCEAKTIIDKIGQGITGLTKVFIGMNKASEADVNYRRSICIDCPSRIVGEKDSLVSLSRCRTCWCLIVPKTKLSGEKCPESKW
jgi:hypothetical protein